MKRIPNAREVDKALAETKRATRRVLKSLNQLAGQVMSKGRYGSAEALVATGKRIQEFQNELEVLRKRWTDIKRAIPGSSIVPRDSVNTLKDEPATPQSGRLRKGLKTPSPHYRNPILQALNEFGGSAYASEVLERVHTLVRERLKDVDYGKLGRGQARWENTARWERKRMVQDGLIKEGSRKGVWELTAVGREAAEELDSR